MWRTVLALSLLAFMAQADVTINGHNTAIAAANVAQIHDKLITAAQPSADDLTTLAKAGVAVVIDLRGTQEERGFNEAAISQQLGVKYINLPIAGGEDVTFENAQKLDQILQQHKDSSVLLHCASSNRVGALMALRAKQHGASNDEALAAGRAAGMKSLEARVQSLFMKE